MSDTFPDESDPGIRWVSLADMQSILLAECSFETLLGAREDIARAVAVAATVHRLGEIDNRYILSLSGGTQLGDAASSAKALVELTGRTVWFRFQETVWRISKDD